jgi:hypothetical protein
MYRIKISGHSVDTGNWGNFTAYKAFDVIKVLSNNSSNKNRINRTNRRKTLKKNNCNKPASKITNINGIHGYIIQKVTKRTNAQVLCGNGIIKNIKDIAAFTNENVKYMNEDYYELFPILNGKSCSGDSFQNGEILQYFEFNDGIMEGDNNPPTRGIIEQTGRFCFIAEPFSSVKNVVEIMNRNRKIITDKYIDIFGIKWNINTLLPANGLPYNNTVLPESMFMISDSNTMQHIVNVEWNGIFDYEIKKNNMLNLNNTKISDCKFINETSYNKTSDLRNKQAKTKINSIFVDI